MGYRFTGSGLADSEHRPGRAPPNWRAPPPPGRAPPRPQRAQRRQPRAPFGLLARRGAAFRTHAWWGATHRKTTPEASAPRPPTQARAPRRRSRPACAGMGGSRGSNESGKPGARSILGCVPHRMDPRKPATPHSEGRPKCNGRPSGAPGRFPRLPLATGYKPVSSAGEHLRRRGNRRRIAARDRRVCILADPLQHPRLGSELTGTHPTRTLVVQVRGLTPAAPRQRSPERRASRSSVRPRV